MKKLFWLFLFGCVACAQVPYNVKFQNFIVPTFKADSIKYTSWFNIADLSNVIVTARFSDTANAGFKGDSCAFFYFLELGNITYNVNGGFDTALYQLPIVLDTVNATVDANWKTATYNTVDASGVMTEILKALDSVKVSGFGTNSRGITIPASCYARVGVRGIAGNKVGAFVRVSIDVVQFRALKVDSKYGE